MFEGLLSAHSGFRWIVLLLLLISIVNSLRKWKTGLQWNGSDRLMAMLAMSAVHLQFLIGIYLYFTSSNVEHSSEMMGDSMLRFFSLEHPLIMIFAIILITVGYVRAKKAIESAKKFKLLFMYYFVGLALIIAGIPWPFRGFGSGWF